MPVSELKIVGTATASNSGESYKTLLSNGKYNLVADEPVSAGGNNEGPAPGDYLCMSLAACKVITLRMYVQRKQWPAGKISIKVNLVKADAAAGVLKDTFMCEVEVSGDLTIEQKERLHQIDKACPVSKLLTKGADTVSVVK